MTIRRTSFAIATLVSPALANCTGGYCEPGKVKSTAGFDVKFNPDGGITPISCEALCQTPGVDSCYFIDAGLVQCAQGCYGGRIPPGGLALTRVDTVGTWLGRMAQLEAAAVVAFDSLAHELDAHAMPAFADAALSAALEEVRHSSVVARLAMGSGVVAPRLEIRVPPIRSIDEIAIDNASEGCGREMVGALVNRHQASEALDPRVRLGMSNIAADEESHARFSVALAQALMPRLTVAQRRRVREAQEQTLTNMVGEELSDRDARELGLMDEGQLKVVVGKLLDTARI